MAATEPVVLRTQRLLLDQPTLDDVDRIAEYCTDPLFKRYMTTPWPYRREHAVGFVTEYVPSGWATGREATWAIRAADSDADGGAPMMGAIGIRFERPDLGYWLGVSHRGRRVMTEAVHAVTDWMFLRDAAIEHIEWECIVGNIASARTARATGFRFTGEGPAKVLSRDGSTAAAWHAELRRADATARPGTHRADRSEGWPAALDAS